MAPKNFQVAANQTILIVRGQPMADPQDSKTHQGFLIEHDDCLVVGHAGFTQLIPKNTFTF